LILAIPSKGRLQESTLGLLDEAGLSVSSQGGKARDYTGVIASLDRVDVHFLQAAEIIQALADGQAHLGVCGEDLLRESLESPDLSAQILKPLGFGHADLVIAVPRAWIDVETLEDLDDVCHRFVETRGTRLRVATKFTRLTRAFFASHGIHDYRIVESLGATEGAPNAGTAEIVVDITSTGATLADNGLKILRDGLMLKSQACLIASKRAAWDAPTGQSLRRIMGRIESISNARRMVMVSAFGGNGSALATAAATIAGVSPTGEGRFLAPKANAASLAEALTQAGATQVITQKIDALALPQDEAAASAFLSSRGL
jgi:ATP phosphoribosyltransferase